MYNFTFIILILYILFLTYNKHIYLSVHVNIYTETRMIRVNGEKKPERWIVGSLSDSSVSSQLGSYPSSSDMNHVADSNHLPRFLPIVTT